MNKDIATMERAITSRDIFKEKTRKNMKEAAEELGVLALAWDYENSTKNMKRLVYKWKNMTVEVMRGLWEAHYVLTEAGKFFRENNLNGGKISECQKFDVRGNGDNRDLPNVKNLTHGKTWGDYCSEIGITRQTAHNWLKRFVPREYSASGEDRMLSPEELSQITAEESEVKESWIRKMVDQYEITKVRPPEWTQACENELQRRATSRRIEKKVDEMVSAWSNKPKYKQMTFFQQWEKANELDDIRLPDPSLTQYQFKFFEAVDDYLLSLDDFNIRTAAARNLREKIARRMNEDFYNQLTVENQIREAENDA